MGNEGSREDHGIKGLLDLGKNGPPHSNKLVAKVVSNLVRVVEGLRGV